MSSSLRKARPGSLSPGTPYLIYLMAQTVKNLPAMQETWIQSVSGRSPGEGNGNPQQGSRLGNPMDRLVGYSLWVAKSWTQLSD